MPRQKRPFRRKSPALLLSENFTQRLLPAPRFSGGSPLVVMMQAADFWESHDPALLERLNPATFGSIFVQTQVRAPVVIIRKILLQEVVQMRAAQNNDMIQTFTPNRTNQTFHIR